jgi:hypothetical protein
MLARAEQIVPPEPSATLIAASPALKQEIGTARELHIVPVNLPRPQTPPSQDDPRHTVTGPGPSVISPTSGWRDTADSSLPR